MRPRMGFCDELSPVLLHCTGDADDTSNGEGLADGTPRLRIHLSEATVNRAREILLQPLCRRKFLTERRIIRNAECIERPRR